MKLCLVYIVIYAKILWIEILWKMVNVLATKTIVLDNIEKPKNIASNNDRSTSFQ